MTLSPTPTLSPSTSRLSQALNAAGSLDTALVTASTVSSQQRLRHSLLQINAPPKRTSSTRSTYPVLLTAHHVASRAYPHTGTSSHTLVYSRICSVLSRLPMYTSCHPLPQHVCNTTDQGAFPRLCLCTTSWSPTNTTRQFVTSTPLFTKGQDHAPAQAGRLGGRDCTPRLETGVMGNRKLLGAQRESSF
jgi:hypothetical protein